MNSPLFWTWLEIDRIGNCYAKLWPDWQTTFSDVFVGCTKVAANLPGGEDEPFEKLTMNEEA